jgi:tetratricopeptide (TPR) repeat protein
VRQHEGISPSPILVPRETSERKGRRSAMPTWARRQWLGFAVAIVVGSAGCAEKKISEAPKEVAVKLDPCEAATSAMTALQSKANAAAGKNGPVATPEQPVLLPAEVLRARNLLRREAPKCYEQRLLQIRAVENSDRQKAVEDYESLKAFVGALRAGGIEFPVIDFDAKIAELKGIDTGAEEAYAAAEAALQGGRCQEAIPLYRRSLELVANYRDARRRLADCHYELAAGALQSRLYRQAAQEFLTAEEYQPNYRDSRVRAARIHFALGNYFLSLGFPRNAVLEFEAAESVLPDFPQVRSQLESAKAKTQRRIAVLGISNPTGSTLEGMAVEEYLADSLVDKLRKRKSPFLELVTRSQLEAGGVALRPGTIEIADQAKLQEVGNRRGVEYLVTGRITQASQKKGGPLRARRATPFQPGTPTRDLQYDEVSWSAEVAVAGSIDVLDVQAGKTVVHRTFDKRESGGGRWVENPGLSETQSRPSAEIRALLSVTSPAAMASRAVESLAEELVSAILGEIDRVPPVPDPTGELGELQEPKPPTVVTAPSPSQEAQVSAPKPAVARPQARVKVKGDAVNIRPDPSTRSQPLARARRGDVFPLVSRQKDWVKIRLGDGREGWISVRLVEMLPE